MATGELEHVQRKVYYNSACPVCDAGIKDQRRRMEACGVKDVEWIDVHTHPDAVLDWMRSWRQCVSACMSRPLLARSMWARMRSGLRAQTPGQQRLANLLRLPILKQFTRISLQHLCPITLPLESRDAALVNVNLARAFQKRSG